MAEVGNADRINGHAKASFTKVEASHQIIQIKEIEVEKGVNFGS